MLRLLDAPQRTLGGPVTLEGYGVFTGVPCAVTISPAVPDAGLWITSLPYQGAASSTRIEITPASLRPNPNRTSLGNAGSTAQVTMVEHVLSLLHGMAIDNAHIAIRGGECPLGDGSAQALLEQLDQVGIVEQPGRRQVLEVLGERRWQSGSAVLEVGPPQSEGLTVEYTLDYAHPQIGTRTVHYQVTPALYRELIGPARTFIPIEEAERLAQAGVLQATAAECLVIYPDRINHPLRHPDELAAHKVLDLIGDLRLCGWPVWGHVRGVRSGHGLNQEAARWLSELAG